MDNSRIRKYFLGGLDSAEAESFELEIISNAELETELQMAETDLIEDFLEGTLDPDETKAFEQNYLITVERQKQVEIIRQLKLYSQKKPLPEDQPGFFDQLKSLFNWQPAMVVVVGLALIVALGLGWSFFFTPDPNDKELIALNQKDLSNLEEFKGLTNLNLSAGQLRSDATLNPLNRNNLSEQILLRLALPAKTDSQQTFTVKISQDGKILHTLKQVTHQNQEVRLLLPKSILSVGNYQVILEITLENGIESYNYFFAVR